MAANEDLKLIILDIRMVFLQANELDRDVYLMPPKDVRKEAIFGSLRSLYMD